MVLDSESEAIFQKNNIYSVYFWINNHLESHPYLDNENPLTKPRIYFSKFSKYFGIILFEYFKLEF